MARTDLYVKVVIDHDAEDKPEKLGAEVVRVVSRIYGVRSAELTNWVTRSEEGN